MAGHPLQALGVFTTRTPHSAHCSHVVATWHPPNPSPEPWAWLGPCGCPGAATTEVALPAAHTRRRAWQGRGLGRVLTQAKAHFAVPSAALPPYHRLTSEAIEVWSKTQSLPSGGPEGVFSLPDIAPYRVTEYSHLTALASKRVLRSLPPASSDLLPQSFIICCQFYQGIMWTVGVTFC